MFDLSRRETFEEMEHFWTLLMEKSPNANVVLVGKNGCNAFVSLVARVFFSNVVVLFVQGTSLTWCSSGKCPRKKDWHCPQGDVQTSLFSNISI